MSRNGWDQNTKCNKCQELKKRIEKIIWKRLEYIKILKSFHECKRIELERILHYVTSFFENLVNRLQSFLKASNNIIHPRYYTLKTSLKLNLTTEDTNWYLSH